MNKLLLLLLLTTFVLASKSSRNHLLFGYLTPLALGLASSAATILVVALAVACYFDNRSRRGLSKSAMSHPLSRWVPRETQIRQDLSKDVQKSDEEPSTAVDIDDLRGETVHKVQPLSMCSSRLDPQMKHNKIIEAIYKASGRELPEEYKTKGGAAEVHGTKELNQFVFPLTAVEECNENSQVTQASEKTEVKSSKESKTTETTQRSENEVEMKTALSLGPKKDNMSEERKKEEDTAKK